jgi:hypothetical protein
VHGAVDDDRAGPTPCGSDGGRTRTSATTTADPPPPQEDPPRGGPAVRSRRGRTRGRTTDHLGGETCRAAADDAVAPWEPDGRIVAVPPVAGVPSGSPPGAGAEPHRQGGGRSPTRRGRWDDDQGKAPRTLTPRGLPRARTRFPTTLPTCPQARGARTGASTTRSGGMSGSIHRSCPHLVHGDAIRAGDEPACCGQRVHATVDDGTRPGAAAVPPRGGPDRERRVTRPSRAAAASGPRGPRGCGARPG